jgi:hypothetical protein
MGVLTRGEPLRATGTHVGVAAHITDEELRVRLGGVEQVNGFGNRFLWFRVHSDKIIPHTTPVPPEVFAPFAERLRAVAKYPAGSVPLSPDADAMWVDVYPSLREGRPDLAGAMTARGTAFVLRLALIYCLLDEKPNRTGVQPDHLRAALAVWEYSVASAYMLFQSVSGSSLGDKLLSLLANGSMKRNEFTNHISRPSGEIEAELNKLLEAGRVMKAKEKRSGAGRPAEVWQLVDEGGAQ